MTDDNLIYAYFHCNHKAYLLLNYPNEAAITDFFKLEDKIKNDIQIQFYLKNTLIKSASTDLILNKFSTQSQILYKSFLKNDEINFSFTAVEGDKKNLFSYQITIFDNPTKEEKQIAIFKAITLKNILNIKITDVVFVKGVKLKTSKVKLAPFIKPYSETSKNLASIINKEQITKPSNKPHCQICQFQNYCRKQLVEKEDLSLLSGLREKEIIKKQSKGIFSVSQLAFTFSPKKKLYSKKKFLPELKALAIKEKKTYIIKPPENKTKEIEVFLDIEGLPDNKSYYLIGILVKKGDSLESFSYWKEHDTNQIFNQFLDLMATFDDFVVYHYGTYEVTALKKQQQSIEGTPYQNILEKVLLNCVNILNEFLESVYPPTFTNSLKEIASFIGFDWQEHDINGYKSIFWRKYWEITGDLASKRKLINYNLEDTKALLLVVDWLKSLNNSLGVNFEQVEDIKKQSAFKFGDSGYIEPV